MIHKDNLTWMEGRLLAIEKELKEMWDVAHHEGGCDELELQRRLSEATRQVGHAHLAVKARPQA